jgi:hypothetical protein
LFIAVELQLKNLQSVLDTAGKSQGLAVAGNGQRQETNVDALLARRGEEVGLTIQFAGLIVKRVAIVRISGSRIISHSWLGEFSFPLSNVVEVLLDLGAVREITALIIFRKAAAGRRLKHNSEATQNERTNDGELHYFLADSLCTPLLVVGEGTSEPKISFPLQTRDARMFGKTFA